MNTTLIKNNFFHFFDLRHDTEYIETEKSIRKNSEFKSDNAWNLIFAIIIASVGLNVNSTAVIIGAMLISPLMGPIIGIGFSLGINDSELFRKALKNLFYAIILSLLSSTLFFLFSPISTAQSEIIARTYPTVFDVLIAIFGGATGIVAISRKEKNNAIPGVAIATALMPPLCTAGYGIANLNFPFFIGALYLFLINSVFIAISTYLFVRLLKFRAHIVIDQIKQKKINKIIMSISTLLIIPSLILAWGLLRESSFKTKTDRIIDNIIIKNGTIVVSKKFNHSWFEKSVELTLMGNNLSELQQLKLNSELKKSGIELKEFNYKFITDQNLYDELSKLKSINSRLAILKNQNKKLTTELNEIEMLNRKCEETLKELIIFEPNISKVSWLNNSINVHWKIRPSKFKKNQIDQFLKNKFGENFSVSHLISL